MPSTRSLESAVIFKPTAILLQPHIIGKTGKLNFIQSDKNTINTTFIGEI